MCAWDEKLTFHEIVPRIGLFSLFFRGPSSIPASLHFSFQSRLSSAKNRQLRHVCAARSKSRGSRKDSTVSANSFGSNEMKSRWNWGSITCIMCRTWVSSQRWMSSSMATIRSAFDQCWNSTNHSFIPGGGFSLVGMTLRHCLCLSVRRNMSVCVEIA